MEVLKLHENMQLQNSPEDGLFASWLLDIGHRRDVDEKNKVELPQEIITYEEDELIQHIYGDIDDSNEIPPPTYFLDHAILAPRNIDIQGTNTKILTKMPSNAIVYHSADSLEVDNLHERADDAVLYYAPSFHVDSTWNPHRMWGQGKDLLLGRL